MVGTMVNDVILLGTSLRLCKGEKVTLTRATNQPAPKNDWYFAQPHNGIWYDGVERNDDSILVSPDDVVIHVDLPRFKEGEQINITGGVESSEYVRQIRDSEYNVKYCVRHIGAIGRVWTATDTVCANNEAEAYEAFRDAHKDTYEFFHPISAEKVVDNPRS